MCEILKNVDSSLDKIQSKVLDSVSGMKPFNERPRITKLLGYAPGEAKEENRLFKSSAISEVPFLRRASVAAINGGERFALKFLPGGYKDVLRVEKDRRMDRYKKLLEKR